MMRKAVTLVAKAAVSGLLLYFALDLVNIETVRDRLSQINPAWLVLGFLILVIQPSRWRFVGS